MTVKTGVDSQTLVNQINTDITNAHTSVYSVSSQAQMLSLDAQKGDIAVRIDTKSNYILSDLPASTLSNWVELKQDKDLFPSVPYSMHIAGGSTAVSSITLVGEPCFDVNAILVLVSHTVVPPSNYSLDNTGTILTFTSPVEAGLDIDLRWYSQLAVSPSNPFANPDLSNLSATGESHFQSPLVSGTNIKTVNNESLLGSGDITISAGANTDLSNLSATGNAKFQAPITLTASKALVSNSSGKVAASSVTSTELGYLSGTTSKIQTQLNNKLGSINYGSATDVTSSVFTASGTGYKPTKKGALLIKVYNSIGYCDINIYNSSGTAILSKRMNNAPGPYTSAGGSMELLLDSNYSVRITINAGTAGTDFWATFFPYA